MLITLQESWEGIEAFFLVYEDKGKEQKAWIERVEQ